MGTEELSQANSSRANTGTEEVSVRQVSSAAPSLDPQVDHSSMIRHVIREELHRGLGRRSHHSERDDSGSSPSSQEDSHSIRSSSRSRSSRQRLPAPSHRTRTPNRSPRRHSSRGRALSRASLVSGSHSRPLPWSSFVKPQRVPRRLFRAGPSPRPPWAGCLHYVCHAAVGCLRVSSRVCVFRSAASFSPVVSVDDASSSL